jgi:NADPH:quinone reductase-like Zn-dependent oxidoreductase
VIVLYSGLLCLLAGTAFTLADAPGELMSAIVYRDYGTADVLRLEEIAKPVPDEGRVLIEVHAAAANPLDWHYMRGTPYIMRMDSGWSKPESGRLGVDLAGVVVAVGPNVTGFKPGDEVFGTGGGAFAEYARASAKRIAPKPANLTFEQAASVPVAAITALQGLRDKGRLESGQKVLINGASGGVGTFAVQIAKALGAEVTGVCSTRNLELVRSLGADHVIDYTRQDVTQSDERYDVILDNVGNLSLSAMKRLMTPHGRAVLIGGGGPGEGRWIGPMGRALAAMVWSPFVSQDFAMLLAEINTKDLETLSQLIESGKVTPVIDQVFPLSQVPAAIRYLEDGHARGKVIITPRSRDATS